MNRIIAILAALTLLFGIPATVPASAGSVELSAAQKRAAKKKSTRNKNSGIAPKSTAKKTGTKKKTTKKASAKQAKPRTAAEVKEARRRNSRAIKETDRKITLNTRETETRLNQLNLLEGEIADISKEIKRMESGLRKINRNIALTNDSIKALDTRLNNIQREYIHALRRSQGKKNKTSELAFIFSSKSFAQAYRRSQSLKQFNRWRKLKSVEINELKERLDARHEKLASLQEQSAKQLARLTASRATLLEKQEATGSLITRLRKEGSELRQIMNRRQQEATQLDAELDRIIAEEARRQEELRRKQEEAQRKAREEAARKAREEAERKAREAEEARLAQEAQATQKTRESDKTEEAKRVEKEAKKAEKERKKAEKKARKQKPVKHKGKNNTATPHLPQHMAQGTSGVASGVAIPSGVDFDASKGKLPFPVEGQYTIVKRFGRQKHPTLPHVETNNSGIDIATTRGGNARAVFDGEVSAVFRPDGYNNVIVIRHGRYMTVYANLGSISVSTGQQVKAGQTIGTIHADPSDPSARSVLHFEIRNQKQKENPELWLKH